MNGIRGRRGRLRAVLAAALLLMGLGLGGCSTDTICQDACDAWEGCWSFDECWDECKSDGDWSNGYVSCVQDNAGDCFDLEVNCPF